MKLRFHPQALAECEHAVLYYQSKQAGLGVRFAASISSAINGVMDAPETFPVFEFPVRRRLARVFPYAILYAVMTDEIFILAVMHCHRKPNYWCERLHK